MRDWGVGITFCDGIVLPDDVMDEARNPGAAADLSSGDWEPELEGVEGVEGCCSVGEWINVDQLV